MKRLKNFTNGRTFGNDDLLNIQAQFDAIVAQYKDYAPIVISGGKLLGTNNVAKAMVLFMDGSTPVLAEVPAITSTLTGTSGVVLSATDSNSRTYGDGTARFALRDAAGTFAASQGGTAAANWIPLTTLGYDRYWYNVPVAPRKSVQWTFESDFTKVFDTATGLGVGLWQGWALCDGNNGTPNMKSKYLIGYNADATGYGSGVTDIVGGNTKTLTPAQIPHVPGSGEFASSTETKSYTTTTTAPATSTYDARPWSMVGIPMYKL